MCLWYRIMEGPLQWFQLLRDTVLQGEDIARANRLWIQRRAVARVTVVSQLQLNVSLKDDSCGISTSGLWSRFKVLVWGGSHTSGNSFWTSYQFLSQGLLGVWRCFGFSQKDRHILSQLTFSSLHSEFWFGEILVWKIHIPC